MTPISYLQAAQIMERILQHPCAGPFIRDDNFDSQTQKRYSSLITRPISLSKINHKLAHQKYENVNQWYSDMELIAENTAKVYGRYSNKSILAQEMLRLFDKEWIKFVSWNQTKWTRLFGELSHNIQFQLNKAPEILKCDVTLRSSLNLTLSSDINAIYEDSEEEEEENTIKYPLPEVDIDNFLSAVSELSNPHDVKALGSIIEKRQPDLISLEKVLEIDVTKLTAETMNELIDYVKERYHKMKKDYPNA